MVEKKIANIFPVFDILFGHGFFFWYFQVNSVVYTIEIWGLIYP